MGFIERLRQEAEARELEKRAQQAKLVEAEVLHKQRKDQAATFQTESGVGDLVSTATDLLKKTRFPDASYSKSGAIINQRNSEPDSVFDNITFNEGEIPGDASYSPRKRNQYVTIATRPSGEIVFYAEKKILISETDWRNDKEVLERTLEQALNSPGIWTEPGKEIHYATYRYPTSGFNR